MITGAKMTLGASSKKKKSVLLGLLIQIWPGLVSSKCCDYLKVCAILGAVAKLTLVLADVSPFLMLSGSKCSACLFRCVPSRNLPHFLYYTSDTGDMGLTDSAFRLLPAHCCRPYSPLWPGYQQWFLPHAEAAASPSLFPFPASPRLWWVWDVIMCRATCQNHKNIDGKYILTLEITPEQLNFLCNPQLLLLFLLRTWNGVYCVHWMKKG